MSMERGELKQIIAELEEAYKPRMKDLKKQSQKQFDLWYECFKDKSGERLYRAVIRIIAKSSYFPSIAELNRTYDEIFDEDRARNQEIMDIYKRASGIYPWGSDNESFELFRRHIRKIPKEQQIEAAKKFARCVETTVRACELDNTMEDLPAFAEFVKGVCK